MFTKANQLYTPYWCFRIMAAMAPILRSGRSAATARPRCHHTKAARWAWLFRAWLCRISPEKIHENSTSSLSHPRNDQSTPGIGTSRYQAVDTTVDSWQNQLDDHQGDQHYDHLGIPFPRPRPWQQSAGGVWFLNQIEAWSAVSTTASVCVPLANRIWNQSFVRVLCLAESWSLLDCNNHEKSRNSTTEKLAPRAPLKVPVLYKLRPPVTMEVTTLIRRKRLFLRGRIPTSMSCHAWTG